MNVTIVGTGHVEIGTVIMPHWFGCTASFLRQ